MLEHKGKVIGLEIKSGHTEHASDMAAFEQQCKPYKVLLIGNSGIPWQEFLELESLELFGSLSIVLMGMRNPAFYCILPQHISLLV